MGVGRTAHARRWAPLEAKVARNLKGGYFKRQKKPLKVRM